MSAVVVQIGGNALAILTDGRWELPQGSLGGWVNDLSREFRERGCSPSEPDRDFAEAEFIAEATGGKVLNFEPEAREPQEDERVY